MPSLVLQADHICNRLVITVSDPSSAPAPHVPQYRTVLIGLAIASALGAAVAFVIAFSCPVVMTSVPVLLVAAAMMSAVAGAHRERPSRADEAEAEPAATPETGLSAGPPAKPQARADEPGLSAALMGGVAVAIDLILQVSTSARVSTTAAIVGAGFCLLAAGVAALVAHYLGRTDHERLPEASGLRRGARLAAWLLVFVAAAVGAQMIHQRVLAWSFELATLLVVALVCMELGRRAVPRASIANLAVFGVLGRRANFIAGALDAAEEQLGIDLRSTWALAVVRRYVQPLVLGLCVLGWLSTSFTVIATGQAGLLERFGVAADGPPLEPGIHVHWPWPIDRVIPIDASRVRTSSIGHEGEEAPGPENVLWAKQHAKNEYTLVLGDGHDLITVDASVQYRIRDPHAWTYVTQNPADALRALAYRAVMRATVNRTLDEALTGNVQTLTAGIRVAVQADADALGLGVDIVAFTIGGMHPPVAVAHDYQAVVSAELAEVTAIVSARAARNASVPAAEAEAVVQIDTAQEEAAAARARAAGDAWSFRAIEAQYDIAPAEYRFRRRLESLEKAFEGRHFTVVDQRIMRDGGELWLTP